MKKLFLGFILSFLITMPAFGALHLHWSNGQRIWYDGAENIFWIRTGSEGLRIGDDIPFHFGDDDDSYIKYISSTDTFQISGNTIELTGGTVNLNEIQLLDGKYLTFGTGDDMRARWTGSLFEWTPSTDDYVFSFGTAASTQLSVDLRWYGATSAVTVLFDAGLSDLILTGVELKTDQQITSTLADGTAFLVLTSTTKVDNLNADKVDGQDWADPGEIGGTTAASATFTDVTLTGTLTAATAHILSGSVPASIVTVNDSAGYWDVSNVEDSLAQIGNWATNRVSKGWYTGGTVTCNAGVLTVNVSSGTGNYSGTRDISWSDTSNLSITANTLNYIYVDTADSVVKNTTTKATADAQIPLAIVLTDATEGIKISPYKIAISDFHYQIHHYLKKIIGPVCESGMGVSINTPSDLNIVVDTGAFHWGLFHYDYTTTSPATFTYWYKLTSGATTYWTKTTSQTSCNTAKYNLNTAGSWSYADLGGGKYRKDIVCIVPKTDGTLHIAIVLGQEQFNNLAQARNGSIPTLGDLETMGFASLAYIIYQQGDTDITEVGDMRPLLGQYGAMQDHGSLTGLGDNDHPQYMLGATYDSNEDGIIADAQIASDVTVAYIPTLTKTATYSVTTSDFGKSIRVTSAGTVTMTLPSVGADEDGALLRFVKCGAGKLILDAADSDKIADSGAGGTIYNDVSTQTFATISLEYVHSITTWIIRGAHGTWTTTN